MFDVVEQFYNTIRRELTIGFKAQGGISLTGCPSSRQQLT